MTCKITRLLTFPEYCAMQDDAMARGFWRNDSRIFTPGMAWPEPWYFDPLGELADLKGHGYRSEAMIPAARKGELGFLSVHYWRDWADKRPPLAVVCPNGEVWEVDRKSSNGDGWVVKGDALNLVCSPSIVVDGYHGFLGINGAPPGQFTADVEGRGPVGIVRPITERHASA